MTARIFLTGASGYIGGEVLHQLAQLSVQHQIRCLVRNSQKAELIKKAIPHVHIVNGDLEDTDIIEREAASADVVFHLASTRHEPSSQAIIRGLKDASRQNTGYWIQIGGASMFAGSEIKAGIYGEAGGKVYDDVKDIEEIRNVIKGSPARVVDNLILAQGASQIKTALVAGPIIYGKGKGPVNTRSIQGPAIAEYALKNGESFQLGKGENIWSTVHVADIGKIFIQLLDTAISGRDDVWNENGILLPENGSISFGEFGRLVSQAARAQGLIQSEEIRSLSAEEVNQIIPHGAVVLGTNARTSSSRANKYLQWIPTENSLREDIPRLVKDEGDRLKSGEVV